MQHDGWDPEYTLEDYRLSVRTARLENEYDNSIGRATQLLSDEKHRLLRVEQLLLHFESDSLRWQLDHANQKLAKVASSESDTKLQLQETRKELDNLETVYRASSHDIDRLRHELAFQANSSVDSQKLLAENVRLLKDLSDAQAEIERLKPQKTSFHTLLSEKQALQQQLTSMEVQVENQKKAHERNVAKESDKAKEIVALSSRLEETRKQLMAEVKARDGCERAAQGQALDWAAQRAALEAKLDALNKKLQSRKDQPQGPVAELQRSHNAPGNYESGINKTGSRIVPPQPPNTRLNHDLTIATPGAVRAKDKKPKKPTLPGDKSAFSITPFLNRIHEPRGSPTSSGDDIDELHAVYVADGIIQSFGNSDRKGNEHEIREHVGSTGSVLRETYRKLPDNSDSYERNKETSSANRQHSNHEQPRLKKRKLGVQRDRNFFEGEDDDDNFRDTRRPGCKLGLNTGRNPASQSSAPSGGSIGRGRGFGAFSGFSPLKRDRKRL